MRDRAGREPHVDEGDVRHPGSTHERVMADISEGARRASSEGSRSRAAEVPDDARIRLVQAEVHAAHRDEEDLAELARADQLLDLHDRRAVQERVARQHDSLRSARPARSSASAEDEANGFSIQTCFPAVSG